jgi:hypothetical protein
MLRWPGPGVVRRVWWGCPRSRGSFRSLVAPGGQALRDVPGQLSLSSSRPVSWIPCIARYPASHLSTMGAYAGHETGTPSVTWPSPEVGWACRVACSLRRGARLSAGGAGLAVRLMGDHLSAARSETRPATPEEHRRHPVQAETPGHTGHPHRIRTRPVHSAPHLTTNPPRRPGPLTQPQDRSGHYVTYGTLRGDRTGSTLLPHCFLDPCPGPLYRPWAGYQDRKSNHTRTDQGFDPRCSALPPHHDRRRSSHSVDPEQDCP